MRSRHDESGSTLIMALLVLLFVAVVTIAGLSYAGTSAGTSGQAITPARTSRYDADSALQGAIQYVKRNQAAGGSLGKDTGRPCPPSPGADPNATFSYPGTSGNVTVYICPQLDSFNLDGNARAVILTLAPPNSGEGISFARNIDYKVFGDVWSNSTFTLGSSASVTVDGGKVWSWNTNSCSSGITAPAGKDCSANVTFDFTTLNGALNASQASVTVASSAKFPASGDYLVLVDNELMRVTGGQGTNTWTVSRAYSGTTGAAHSNGAHVRFIPKTGIDPADPMLGHSADWQPEAAPGPVQTPTTCTWSPGVYASGSALTARTTACPGGVTLNPGVYYLNFPAADDTWTINENVTGACDGTDEGAQLVFANESKLAMAGSDQALTLCGRRVSPTAPQIAMTYMKTSTGAGPTMTTTLRPGTATDVGSSQYYTSSSLAKATPAGSVNYPQDSPSSNATATIAKNKTAELRLSNFAKLPADTTIPADAVITKVLVKVAHNEPASTSIALTPAPRLTWGSCSASLAGVTTSNASTLYTSGNLSASFASCASANPASQMTLDWNTEAPNSDSQPWVANFDGAQVEVTWHSPGVVAQTGCVQQLFSAGGCALMSGPENGHDTMNITGVVYLPKNQFAGVFKNGGSLTISDALIARSVDIDANPATTGAPIIGGETNQFVIGKVTFQAFIAGTNWTDTYAIFNKETFVPTINSWVVKR